MERTGFQFLRRTLAGFAALVCLSAGPLVGVLAQTDASRLYQKALDAERRQDWAAAAQAYRGLLSIAPELPELLNNLGIALHYQGRYLESAGWLEKALAKNPEMTGARLFLGIDHYLLGQYDLAVTDLTQVTRREPGNAAAWLHLGAAQLARGATAEAIGSLETADRLNPDDIETLHTLGQAYLTQSRALFAQSKNLYERILEKAPNSPRTHQILAEAFLSQEQPERAIQSYRRAIELKPDDPGLHAALGETFFQLGKNGEAREQLERALALQPGRAKASFELAVIDNLEAKFREALVHLDQAAAGMEEIAELHIERAKAQAGLEQTAQAIESLRRALQLDPGNGPAHYQLAQLYRRTGETELARHHLEEFTRLEKAAEASRQSEAKLFLEGRKP